MSAPIIRVYILFTPDMANGFHGPMDFTIMVFYSISIYKHGFTGI